MFRHFARCSLREAGDALPIGRFGRPEKIAATALLLAGPDGGFYVGATLSPIGGDVMYQGTVHANRIAPLPSFAGRNAGSTSGLPMPSHGAKHALGRRGHVEIGDPERRKRVQ